MVGPPRAPRPRLQPLRVHRPLRVPHAMLVGGPVPVQQLCVGDTSAAVVVGAAVNVQLTSTTRIVHVNAGGSDVQGRVWEGVTDTGIPVFAVITRIAVRADMDTAQFDAELQRCADATPESFRAIPSRMIL